MVYPWSDNCFAIQSFDFLCFCMLACVRFSTTDVKIPKFMYSFPLLKFKNVKTSVLWCTEACCVDCLWKCSWAEQKNDGFDRNMGSEKKYRKFPGWPVVTKMAISQPSFGIFSFCFRFCALQTPCYQFLMKTQFPQKMTRSLFVCAGPNISQHFRHLHTQY